MPLTANWHFGRTRNWYLNFGPYAGFLLNAKETTDNIDVKSDIRTIYAGLALGIVIKFPVSNNLKFFIEEDAQGGVINIFKNGYGGVFNNNRASINVGLNFVVK